MLIECLHCKEWTRVDFNWEETVTCPLCGATLEITWDDDGDSVSGAAVKVVELPQ